MKQTKVCFRDPVQIVYFVNTTELIEYRKPYWSLVAVDRFRFKDRINKFEEIWNKSSMQSRENYQSNTSNYGCQ